MNNQYDFNSIKAFAITAIFGAISLSMLNYIATIITICVGVTALAINLKKLFKK
jgi:hypothetical protein